MPQCYRCKDFFPPNYVDIIEGSFSDSEGKFPYKCIFCKLGVDYVEREETRGSDKYVKYTRRECVDDYKKFMHKLNTSRNVKDIINKNYDKTKM